MWKDPRIRARIARKNRRAVLDGRIPMRLTQTRPTEWEKGLIAFAEKHKLPLTYIGDGRTGSRIYIPNGHKHFRIPDFFVEPRSSKKVVLLDGYFNLKEQKEEAEDYTKAGYELLRINVGELTDVEWLLRKLAIFIGIQPPELRVPVVMDVAPLIAQILTDMESGAPVSTDVFLVV